ncbi:MAG: hypothetical protein ABJA35_14350 [Parafilimonas sp.]
MDLPKIVVPRIFNVDNSEAKLLVWGGLRGGLSIALYFHYLKTMRSISFYWQLIVVLSSVF